MSILSAGFGGERFAQVQQRAWNPRVTRGNVRSGHGRPRCNRLPVSARRLPLCPLRRGPLQLWSRDLLPGDGRQVARQHQLLYQLRHLLPAQSQVQASPAGGGDLSAVTDHK